MKYSKFSKIFVAVLIVLQCVKPFNVKALLAEEEVYPDETVEIAPEEEKEDDLSLEEETVEVTEEEQDDEEELPGEVSEEELPEETETEEMTEEEELPEDETAEEDFDDVPAPLTYISENISEDSFIHSDNGIDTYSLLPSSFSLRDSGMSGQVRNQNPYGTCWAHAALASAESTYKMDNPGYDLNLSELHLAYYIWNSVGVADKAGLITKDGNNTTQRKTTDNNTILDTGGNQYYSTFAMASGIGLVNEDYLPYSMAGSAVTGQLNPNDCYRQDYELVEAKWFNASERDTVKRALMEDGAMTISYNHDSTYYNSKNSSYYQNVKTTSNHAVTLVGWDDNYSKNNFKTAAPADGAWLIKNSWGSSWGDDGYFWLSYYDSSINGSLMGQYFIREADNRRTVYQYDGSNSTYQTYYAQGQTVWGANIFTAKKDEVLKEVSFVTGSADVDYTVYIYVSKSGMPAQPDSGTCVENATTSGHMTDAGYHMVTLNNSVSLCKGDVFSVVVSQRKSDGSMTYYYDQSWNTSQGSYTYYFVNDTSKDISYRNEGNGWVKVSSQGISERVKAFTYEEVADENGFIIVDSRLIGYIGTGGNITIPAGVTEIGKDVFKNNSQITGVVIPDTVTVIGEGAFENCQGLKSLIIPASVFDAGARAFETPGLILYLHGIYGYKTYNWELVSNSSPYPFMKNGDVWISSNQNADSSTSKASWKLETNEPLDAFIQYSVSSEQNFDKFTVTLNGKVIVDEISGNTTGTHSWRINPGVHVLEAAYSKDGSVGNLDDEATITLTPLKGHTSLPEIIRNTSPSATVYTEISEELEFFLSLDGSITELEIPYFIETIPSGALSGLKNLKTLIIPSTVKSVEEGALNDTVSLKYVYISSGAENISAPLSKDAKYIFTDAETRPYSWSSELEISGFNMTEEDFAYWSSIDRNVTKLIIPDTVTSIPAGLLNDLPNLLYLEIPGSVTYIAPSAVPEDIQVVVDDNEYVIAYLEDNGIIYFVNEEPSEDEKSFGDVTEEDMKYAGFVEYEDIPDSVWISGLNDYEYTGKAVIPDGVRVFYHTKLLTLSKDYKLSYKNNTKVGVADYVITATGNYTGVYTVNFNIIPRDISDFDVDDIYLVYTGKIQLPKPVVKKDKTQLKLNTDYTLSYDSDVTSVGAHRILIEAKGNYTGSLVIYEYITDMTPVSKLSISVSKAEYGYAPEIVIKDGKTILDNSRFDISYYDGSVVIAAKANDPTYTGYVTKTYSVIKAAISKAVLSGLEQTYSLKDYPIVPSVTVTLNGEVLTEGTDYTLDITNNAKVGSASLVITGIGAYSGTIKKSFKIVGKDINDLSFFVPGRVAYTKNGTVPEFVIRDGSTVLEKGKDYTVTAVNNKTIGTATLTVAGKGSYSGKYVKEYTIIAKDINEVYMNVQDIAYSAKKYNWKSTLTVTDTNNQKLAANTDYYSDVAYTYHEDTVVTDYTYSKTGISATRHAGDTVGINECLPVGTLIDVTINAKGSYYGTKLTTYRIVQASITKAKARIDQQIFNGKEVKPGKPMIVLTLNNSILKPEDYEIVSYANNTKTGNGSITLKGVGNYGGTLTATFKIVPASIYPSINYVSCGADSGAMKTERIGYGSYTLAKNAFVRKGYRFLGWSLVPGGTVCYTDGQEIVTRNSSITLYAVWFKETYYITYQMGEGETNDVNNPSRYQVDDQTIVLKAPKKRGYTFLGWFDVNTNKKIDQIKSGSTGSMTLYPKWSFATYKVTYVLNGGTNSSLNPSTFNINSYYSLEAPTRYGYVFNGWFLDPDYTEEIEEIYDLEGNITLYASWTAKSELLAFCIPIYGDKDDNSSYISFEDPDNNAYTYISVYNDDPDTLEFYTSFDGYCVYFYMDAYTGNISTVYFYDNVSEAQGYANISKTSVTPGTRISFSMYYPNWLYNYPSLLSSLKKEMPGIASAVFHVLMSTSNIALYDFVGWSMYDLGFAKYK